MNKFYIWISIGIIMVSVNIAKNFSSIHSFRAIYVNDLIQNTNWPDRKKAGYFVIGVLGNTKVTQELKELSKKKKAGAKEIIVSEIANIDSIAQYDIIYITPDKSDKLETITMLAKDNGILVVTEGKEMAGKGASIHIVAEAGKMKFEINKTAALQANLSFSNKLHAMEKGFN